MKLKHILTKSLLLTALLNAGDFNPNPSWGIDSKSKFGYTVYDTYNEVLTVDEDNTEDLVYFANKIWRGSNPTFLASRVKSETVSGGPCGSSVLLKNSDNWIEIGLAATQGAEDETLYSFLIYKWDENNGGTRKSTFTIKDYIGTTKLGEVIEIGAGLALVKVGHGLHDWVDIIIIDMNNFKPKGIIPFSELEITELTYGQTLKVRHKEPVTRAQILNDENTIEGLPWVNLDVMTNGVLNQDLVNENDFEISVPAAQ